MKTIFTLLLAGIALFGFSLVGHAEVYRCVDEAGHVNFTQHPCSPTQESEKVNLDGFDTHRKPGPAVCKDVEKLADLLFPHIHETDSILDVYTNLGGREYLSAGITAVVNYVYNFRYNPKARQTNVVALTHAKCLDGGFGRITQKDLPDWDRIKYTREKPQAQKQTAAERQAQAETCNEYNEKLTHLRERLAKARDKSEKLQVQVDKEYLEQQLQKHCKAVTEK